MAAPGEVRSACERFADSIKRETLSSALVFGLPAGATTTARVEGEEVIIGIEAL